MIFLTSRLFSFFKGSDTCRITWDQILCWPETYINQSVYIPCPTYVNKFNRRCIISKLNKKHIYKKNF